MAVWLHLTACMLKSSLTFRNFFSFKGFEIFICNRSLETGISQQKSWINPAENYSTDIYLFVWYLFYLSVCIHFQPGRGDPTYPVATWTQVLLLEEEGRNASLLAIASIFISLNQPWNCMSETQYTLQTQRCRCSFLCHYIMHTLKCIFLFTICLL